MPVRLDLFFFVFPVNGDRLIILFFFYKKNKNKTDISFVVASISTTISGQKIMG